jgi:hypothetical protein
VTNPMAVVTLMWKTVTGIASVLARTSAWDAQQMRAE